MTFNFRNPDEFRTRDNESIQETLKRRDWDRDGKRPTPDLTKIDVDGLDWEYIERDEDPRHDDMGHPPGRMQILFSQYINPHFTLAFHRKDKGWTRGEIIEIVGLVYGMFEDTEFGRPGACNKIRPNIDEEERQTKIDDLRDRFGLELLHGGWFRYFVPCISYSSGMFWDCTDVHPDGTIEPQIGS